MLDLHVGRPVTRGALTLFPIWAAGAVNVRGYDLRSQHVTVSELDSGPSVPQLVITNSGPRPLLLLEGELLVGGHQDRVAAETVVVPAHSRLPISVRCVEAQRWAGATVHRRDGRRAPVKVRAFAARGQAEAWQAVDDYQAAYGANATAALVDAIDDVDAEAARLVEGLEPVAFQCGVLVGIGGQPALVEVHDSPRSLAHAWDALLRSAAVDAVGQPAVPTPGRRARRFLDRIRAVPVTDAQPAGEARRSTGRSPYVELAFTEWNGRVVHAAAWNPRHPLLAV